MLTDLEICKRISEIEGKKGFEFMGVFVLSENYNDAVNESHSNSYSFSPCHYEYSPLTDRALLNDLIFKYEVSISFNFCFISVITDKQYEMNFTDIPSLKRNCLLLIIEAHKKC